jgi:hypothetical protein
MQEYSRVHLRKHMALSIIVALNAFYYLNQLSGNPDPGEAGDPAVEKFATAHAQSNVFRISCWETVAYLVRLT